MSLFRPEEFNVWFPAVVVGFLISLVVAALWDFIRRRFWLFVSRGSPSILKEVGLDSRYQSRAEAEDHHQETIDKLNEIARGMNLPISQPKSTNSGATTAVDIGAPTMINPDPATHVIRMTGTYSISSSSENHMYPGETFQGVDCRPVINFTSFFPDGTSKDVTRATKKLYKRHANGRVKRLKSSIILQAPMAIDACVLTEIVELAKYCLPKENRCVFQLGNWAVLYHNAGKVQMNLLKEGDVPVNVEARWQDGKTGITMRGLYLNGSEVKVGNKKTSKILRSVGVATQGAGDLDELHLPTKEFDVPGEDSLILSSKVVMVDGVSLIVRSEASFILPPREKNILIEAVRTQWLRISNFAKKMLQSLLFGAEDCQPECAANRCSPDLESDPEQLELSVQHWKGLSQIELLNTRKEVLLHLQKQRASRIIEPAGPPSPRSHLNFVRDEHYWESWQEGLRVLNEANHRNSNDSHSHTYIRYPPWIAGVAAAGTSSPTSDGNGQNRLRGSDARTNPRMNIPVNERPASGVDSVFPTICENSASAGGSPMDSSSMNAYPGEWYMVTKPIAQVRQALEIIESTCTMSSTVWLNKHQCKRLADRFGAIGEGLEGLLRDENFNVGNASDGSNRKDYPAFDELLTVLRKGETLVSSYIDSKAIISVVSRAENRESFKEIHEELDTLKVQFDFESFSELGQVKDFESSSGFERTNALAKDADQDLSEMPEDMVLIKESKNITGMDMEKAILVVMEKSGLWIPRDEVPSYLRIDPTAVRPVVLNSKRDTVDELGWAALHCCKWMGCDFAAKVFKPAAIDVTGWNSKQLLMEVGSLANLRHPHIVRLVGFGQDADLCVFLTELMDADLRNYMRKKLESFPIPKPRPFKRSEELDIITQIAKGMRYMHTQQYAHRDLKCSNVLVKKFDDYLDVKIADLGSFQKLGIVWEAFKQESQTRRWIAPEAIDLYGGKEPTSESLKKSDVYSFGMTCYEIVTGKDPFDGINEDELLKQIHAGVRPELPGDLDEDLRGLIRQCWDHDPNERPKFDEIVLLLNYIRSKKPVVVGNRFSSQDMVLSLMKKIPQVHGAFTGLMGLVRKGITPCCVEHAIDPSPDSSVWGVKGDGGFQRSDSALSVPEHLRIPPDKLHRVQRIGEGASGTVYKATWLGCTFAVKVFNNTPLNIRALQQEVDFLINVSRHPCIVQMVGLSVDNQRCSIVEEFMDGNLYDLIQSRMRKRKEKGLLEGVVVPFDPLESVPIITKIALGMVSLHSKGVVHRDLKPMNVLVKELPESIVVKLGDFGISRPTHEIGHYLYNRIGTDFWRAPEVFRVGDSSKKPDLRAADVYSFGMTCYAVLTGKEPFSNLQHSERTSVIEGERPTLPALLHPGLKALVQQCWHADPVKRPNFTEICEELQKIRKTSSNLLQGSDIALRSSRSSHHACSSASIPSSQRVCTEVHWSQRDRKLFDVCESKREANEGGILNDAEDLTTLCRDCT